MSALLDGHLPMEEGDLGMLERTYELTIEEASQRALKTVDPPLSVCKTDTLLQIHEVVFNQHLSIFTKELHKLIPNAPSSDQQAQREKKQRRKQLLDLYRHLIIENYEGKIHFRSPLSIYRKK